MPVRVSMRSDMPCSLYWLCCHVAQTLYKPVHTTVFRTACRQLQLTNRDCTCYSVRMHACLRVLTRSDMPCSLYQWCTNPEQAATTQQPADGSKQLHLTKQPAQFASRHLWTCCNVLLRTDKPAVLACCTNPVHTTGTTPASRQLPLSTASCTTCYGTSAYLFQCVSSVVHISACTCVDMVHKPRAAVTTLDN
jgi:hypothetical protein